MQMQPRNLGRFTILLASGLAAAGLAGCGKQSETERARFNEQLGGSASGAPTSVGIIDDTINKDFAGYKPTGASADAGASTAAPATAEGDAVKAAVRAPLDAFAAYDADGLLNAFDPEAVAVLKQDEFKSELQNFLTSVEQLDKVAKSKSGGQAASPLGDFSKLSKSFSDALVVNVVDAQNASVGVDPAKFGDMVVEAMQSMVPPTTPPPPPPAAEDEGAGRNRRTDRMVEASGFVPEGDVQSAANRNTPPPAQPVLPAGMPMPSPDEVRAMVSQMAPMVSIPMKKVGDGWKLAVPIKFTDDHVDPLVNVVSVGKEFFQKMTERIDAAPSGDVAAISAIGNQLGMEMAPKFMAAFGQLQAAFAGAGADATPPPDQPTSENPDQPAQPSNPRAINP